MMPHLEVASPQGVNVSTSVAQETNYCSSSLIIFPC